MAARVADLSLDVWPAWGSRPTTYELRARPDDTLAMLITGGCLLPRILGVWDAAPDPAAAVHMAGARMFLSWNDGRCHFHDAHLDRDYKEETEAVAAFLNRPEVDRRMEAAFVATHHEGIEQILGNALG